MKPGWDNAEASPPNQTALSRLGIFILSLNENKIFSNTFFVPLPEGGIGINFENENEEICIEILNDNRITIITYKKIEEDDEEKFICEHVICTEQLTDYKFEKFMKFELMNCIKNFLGEELEN